MVRATIEDVAKMSGVGIATVSRVLNNSGYVSEKTRKKVMAAIKHFDYQPNLIAKSLVEQSTRLIGVVISDILNPFYSKLIHAIQAECNKHQYAIIFCNTDEDSSKESKYLDLLSNNRVNVVILVGGRGFGDEYNSHLARAAKKTPIVLVNETVDIEGIYCVCCDKEQGAFKMTEHLIGLGHKDIVHIAGYPDFKPTQERLSGFANAMKKHGMPLREDSVIYSNYHISGGYAAGCELLHREALPTAVFASNDLMAIGVMNALQENGITIPREVTVVGSDNILFGDFITPSLTTIDHDVELLGKHAVEMAVSLISGVIPNNPKMIETAIIVRRSSGNPG
jgi:DNA-binding LacI/PurR family transcriptional regulator